MDLGTIKGLADDVGVSGVLGGSAITGSSTRRADQGAPGSNQGALANGWEKSRAGSFAKGFPQLRTRNDKRHKS